MIELGSQYSSDFAEVSESDYVTTEGEDNDNAIKAKQRASNIPVVRDNNPRKSVLHEGMAY